MTITMVWLPALYTMQNMLGWLSTGLTVLLALLPASFLFFYKQKHEPTGSKKQVEAQRERFTKQKDKRMAALTAFFAIALFFVNRISNNLSSEAAKEALEGDLNGSGVCPTVLPLDKVSYGTNFENIGRLVLFATNPDPRYNLLDVEYTNYQDGNLIADSSFEGTASMRSRSINLFPGESRRIPHQLLPGAETQITDLVRIRTKRIRCAETFRVHVEAGLDGPVWQISDVKKFDDKGKPIYTDDLAKYN